MVGDSEPVEVDSIGISEGVGLVESVVDSVGEEPLLGDPGIVGTSEPVVKSVGVEALLGISEVKVD